MAAIEFKYVANIAEASQQALNEFLKGYLDKKEVDVHNIVEVVAKASGLVKTFVLEDGQPVDQDEQKQLIKYIYGQLVKEENNDWEDDPKLDLILDAIYGLRNGEYEIDVGKKGKGWIPCCSSVKLSIKK